MIKKYWLRIFTAFLLSCAIVSAPAQQPQTQTAPITSVNAKYTNGVAPGYWPTPGSGLTLNVAGGTSFCNGSIVQYAAGTLTMSASATNNVYLNTASSCAPAVKTGAFTTADMPIATVVTSGSAITSITDVRSPFTFIAPASGGATFPSSPTSALFTYTSTTGGRAAINSDVIPLFDIPVAGIDDFYLTTTPPSGTGGGNTLIGVGVGLSMTLGAGAGGEGNTVMGYLAGQHMTTSRESTIIGNMAGMSITGNNSGPEDMIFDIIGSEAGASLTNCGGSGVLIGQKSGISDICSSGDVFVGIHTATNTHTSAGNIVTGAFTLDGFTGNLIRNVFVGSSAGQNIATGGTISDTVAIGNTSLNNLDATAGSSGNIAVGSRSGTNCSTCQNNVLIGNSVADSSSNTPVMTGSENVIISTGLSADSLMTSASHNIFIETEQTALTTGTYNFCADQFACGPVTTGSNNVMIGQGAGFFGGNVSDSVALGQSAASHAQNGSQVFIGRFAGQNVIGGTNNTVVGPNSFQTPNSTESNDEAFGAGADMAVGVSNSAQIGTGQNTISHTLQFNGWNFLTDSGVLTVSSCTGCGGGGSGTVTNFTAGNLSPLFTSSVATSTTTPALSFTASTAAQNAVLAGPATGGTGAYTFRSLGVSDIPSLSSLYAPLTNPTGGANNYAPLAAPSFTGGALVTGALTNKQAANTAGSGFNLNSFDGLRSLDCHWDVSDTLQCSIGSSRSSSWVGNYNFMQQILASGGLSSSTTITASGTITSNLGTAAITSATPAAGVTSVTCQTANCDVYGGTYTVVGGTGTTGTFVTLLWPTTTTAWRCEVSQNGGTAFLGLGHSVATATGMTVSSGITIASTTFTFDYNCQP